MSDKDISFGTYVVEGTVLRAGDHVSNGKKVRIPPGIIQRLVENTKKPAPIFDRHGGKNEIGRLMTLSPNEDYSSVEFKSLITDIDIYNNAVVRGYDKISPDIRLDLDDQGNLVDAFLVGASLTNNPGMNFNSVTAKKLEFSKGDTEMTETWVPPTGTQTENGGTTSTPNPVATPPVIEQKQNVVEQPSPEMIEQKPEPSSNEAVIAAADVTKMINDAVASAMRDRDIEAAKQEETQKKLKEVEQQLKTETNPVNKGLLEDYAKVLAERDSIKQENESMKEREYQETLESCRAAGIRNPESYIKGALELTTEQKITLLKNIRANYAKTVPISKSSDQQMSTNGSSSGGRKPDITLDAVAAYYNADTKEFKDMLKQLDIYDKNGKFIGV